MSIYKFSVVVEKDKDGYFAFCPELQDCYTQGDSYEEAMENIRDAIRLHVEDRIENGEDIQQSESVSLTLMEVTVIYPLAIWEFKSTWKVCFCELEFVFYGWTVCLLNRC